MCWSWERVLASGIPIWQVFEPERKLGKTLNHTLFFLNAPSGLLS